MRFYTSSCDYIVEKILCHAPLKCKHKKNNSNGTRYIVQDITELILSVGVATVNDKGKQFLLPSIPFRPGRADFPVLNVTVANLHLSWYNYK